MKSKIYIDDCFIIWVPTSTNPIEDHKSYNSFISLMNKFGTLKWNAESRKLSTTFLDLPFLSTYTPVLLIQHYSKINESLSLHTATQRTPPGIISGIIQRIRSYHLTKVKKISTLQSTTFTAASEPEATLLKSLHPSLINTSNKFTY